jgi:hypothetical protein
MDVTVVLETPQELLSRNRDHKRSSHERHSLLDLRMTTAVDSYCSRRLARLGYTARPDAAIYIFVYSMTGRDV